MTNSNKRIHQYLAGMAVLATFAAGCVTGAELEQDDSTEEIVQNLRLAGYPESEIDVLDDGRVYAGGDAEVSLQASREMVGAPGEKHKGRQPDEQFKQYRTNNLVALSVKNICVNGASFTGT